MPAEFLTFRTFPDKETAESFAEVLQQKGVPYLIEEDALVFDPSYANNPLNKEYLLKIRQDNFAVATKALEDYFAHLLDNVSNDYYLFSFSNDELKEILAKPDEWGNFDYLLAQRLLQQRGVNITAEEMDRLKAKRLAELAKPEKETVSNILGYYVISFLFFPVGIIIGWIWGYSKKNLPNGDRVYAYDDRVRKHGQILFAGAIIIFIVAVLVKFTDTFPHH